ncbi:MAG: hypothetical protein F4Y46_02020 [Chloroflexi bacterium]|nr:hypothetical protein [Chloroflexota bacterium]
MQVVLDDVGEIFGIGRVQSAVGGEREIEGNLALRVQVGVGPDPAQPVDGIGIVGSVAADRPLQDCFLKCLVDEPVLQESPRNRITERVLAATGAEGAQEPRVGIVTNKKPQPGVRPGLGEEVFVGGGVLERRQATGGERRGRLWDQQQRGGQQRDGRQQVNAPAPAAAPAAKAKVQVQPSARYPTTSRTLAPS